MQLLLTTANLGTEMLILRRIKTNKRQKPKPNKASDPLHLLSKKLERILRKCSLMKVEAVMQLYSTALALPLQET